jgi:crotonobetainyl-CoA:carnitine CoA-transferase CaiB-like acyl-CoA transferase
MELPLEHIKVLDLSRMLPGPYCTWLLADMGAEVTRIEQPSELAKGDKAHNITSVDSRQRRRIRAYDLFTRNKKSVLMDLKKEVAREIIYKMAKESDVFVEDYRPGAMERFGLDYEQIRKVNPQIIYCSISLCGQDGPYRRKAGHDPVVLALSGVLSQILDKNNMPVMPDLVPIADIAAGLHAVIGILLALRVKEQEGRGQHIDIGMLDATMPLLSGFYQRYFRDGVIPERRGAQPYLGIWQTKDGHYICTTDLEPQYWSNFCRAIGKEEFIPYQHDADKKEMLMETIRRIILTKTRDEWVVLLNDAETMAAPVYNIDEALQDPQVIHRQMVLEIEDPVLGKVKQLGMPIKLSETPGKVRFVAPPPGSDTDETMRRLGYSAGDIERLIKDGVIQHTYET